MISRLRPSAELRNGGVPAVCDTARRLFACRPEPVRGRAEPSAASYRVWRIQRPAFGLRLAAQPGKRLDAPGGLTLGTGARRFQRHQQPELRRFRARCLRQPMTQLTRLNLVGVALFFHPADEDIRRNPLDAVEPDKQVVFVRVGRARSVSQRSNSAMLAAVSE